MSKPVFNDYYTTVQKEIIGSLAAIEQADHIACDACGGEDCACCKIYIDRQKWLSPDELFHEDPDRFTHYDNDEF